MNVLIACETSGTVRNRWKIRSTFWPGIADAMAEQWGSIEPH